MKVFREEHDNNFGKLCMKKGGSFQNERIFFKSSIGGGGGVDPQNPYRAYATDIWYNKPGADPKFLMGKGRNFELG